MLYLRTLGGLSLEMEGKPASGAAGQRAPLAILAFIGTSGETGASRDRIAALFWPESDAERAHGSLKQALYSLRRDAKSQELLLGTTSLRLNPDVIRCDASDFQSAVAAKNLESAVALYAGEFLEGVHLNGNDEFERWVDRERSIFAQHHASVLENLADSAEAKGTYSEAIGWWRQLVTVDPFSTRIARKYIRALASSGDRKAAMDYAELHQRMIATELNAKPDPKLLELIDDVRLGRVREADVVHRVVASPDAGLTERLTALIAKKDVHSRRLWILTSAIVAISLVAAFVRLSHAERDEALRSMAMGTGTIRVSDGQLERNDRVLVADFRVSDLEPEWSTALAEAVRVSLSESREVTVVQTSLIAEALHWMRVPTKTLDLKRAREVAVRKGVSMVIAGDVFRSDAGFHVHLYLIDANSGNTLADVALPVYGRRDLIPVVHYLTPLLSEYFAKRRNPQEGVPR